MIKFKNAEELEKAYKELEKEFTKKSQKLAEVEKTNYVTLLHNEMDSLLNDYAKRRIADLEAKLAEKETELKQEKEYSKMCFYWKEIYYKRLQELKQQLAEKEKEIEKLNKRIEKQVDNGYKIIQNCKEIQRQAIIERLEKVKELIKNMSIGIGIEIYGTRIKPVEEYINNQIEELKKEMK